MLLPSVQGDLLGSKHSLRVLRRSAVSEWYRLLGKGWRGQEVAHCGGAGCVERIVNFGKDGFARLDYPGALLAEATKIS